MWMMKQGHPEATGKAKITAGFNLPARYVIHTVGPIIPDGEPTREQCANWLRAIMNVYSWQSETAWSPLPSAAFPPAFSAFPTSWLQKSPSGK